MVVFCRYWRWLLELKDWGSEQVNTVLKLLIVHSGQVPGSIHTCKGQGSSVACVKITTEAASHEKMPEIWITFCWPGAFQSKGPRGIDKWFELYFHSFLWVLHSFVYWHPVLPLSFSGTVPRTIPEAEVLVLRALRLMHAMLLCFPGPFMPWIGGSNWRTGLPFSFWITPSESEKREILKILVFMVQQNISW